MRWLPRPSASREWPSLTPSTRALCDLELLLSGAFSPLPGFLGRADYDRVVSDMRLANGLLWPIPITLDVTSDFAARLPSHSPAASPLGSPAPHVALRDPEGVMLAALVVDDVFSPNRDDEAMAVYGTADRAHPGVAQLLDRTNPVYLGGRVYGVSAPTHHDYRELRSTPRQLREEFARRGWSRVVAFQTRNPLHRAHFEMTRRAAEEKAAGLLLHPVVGMTKPGDVDHYTRVRCYEAAFGHYRKDMCHLALLPLAMRMAGPREALWHALIRKNHGATHFIVGRDHAGPGLSSSGQPFYGPYEAQELAKKHEAELGVSMVPFRELVYVEERGAHVPEDEVLPHETVKRLSGTALREALAKGAELPAWYTFPEVAKELRRTHPPRDRQGFTVFFTGLSGAGKSTLANVLEVKLLAKGGRSVTLLDGDIVRHHLSSELGFSREHRDLNIRRIGFVAAEITKAGGIALCAPIAPYRDVRREVREMVERHGGFTLVHVSTPLSVCEARDRKGLYAKARAGLIPEFTGISDPYEPPEDADVILDTANLDPEDAVAQIFAHLSGLGYFPNVASQKEMEGELG